MGVVMADGLVWPVFVWDNESKMWADEFGTSATIFPHPDLVDAPIPVCSI